MKKIRTSLIFYVLGVEPRMRSHCELFMGVLPVILETEKGEQR